MMNNKKRNFLLASLLLCFSSASQSALFGPTDYNECIVDAMKGVTSDVAAREIKRACSEKYRKDPVVTDITNKVLSRLKDKRAGLLRNEFEGSSIYAVEFYNGSEFVITKMTINLTYINYKGETVTRSYKCYDNASPMTNSIFRFILGIRLSPQKISWEIQSLEGYGL